MDFQFKDLCAFFEKFSRISRGNEKSSYLRNYIQKWKEKIRLSNNNKDDCSASFYGLLRLILPGYDRERGPYGMKEIKFSRMIIKMLSLPVKSTDAVQLSSFRASATMRVRDFAEAAYYVLRKYFTTSGDVTIEEIHSLLDVVANKNANNDPQGVEEGVMKLFVKCGSAKLQKWIIRILLKEMHLGMGHKGILNALHPDGAELYANSSSLLEICQLMYSEQRLLDIDIRVFKPFNPMLCKKCDVNVFAKEVPNKCTLYIENKFDGERFQLHMQDGNFRYFSRNGFDYTEKFGATYGEGIFTPQLTNVFKSKVKNVILDGEMMGYNKQTKEFGSKGMPFDVKTLTATAVHQPCFCVFDILLLNGVVLMNESLEKRHSLFELVFVPKEGVIILSDIKETTRKEEVLNALNASVDREEEGIVVKLPNSTYKPGTRSNCWWKVKLEFFEGHMTDLDLLIVGGFYGDGRSMQKKISSFLLAVYSELEDKFRVFARVASGLTDDELNTLEKKIGTYWNSNNFSVAKDAGILFGSQTPDVWIEPKNSCVLEVILTVRASELIKTSHGLFTAGYTLRFPRILRVRTDKPYKDIFTLVELNTLTLENKPVLKLTKAHITMDDIENLIKVKRTRKRKLCSEAMVEVAEVKTNILQNYEFCVLSGSEKWPKNEVQKDILENGGRLTLTEGPSTLCSLAKNDDPKITTFKNVKSKHDIVTLEWLKRVLEVGTFSHYEPTDCLYMSEDSKTKKLFTHDRFGDSYVEPATSSSIDKALENVKQSGECCKVPCGEPARKELCRPLIFYNHFAYFDKYEVINDASSAVIYDSFLDEMQLVFHGGEIFQKLEVGVNVVIINSDERREVVQQYLRENNFSDVEVFTMETFKKSKRV